jgi:hypothetical protein
VVTSKSDSLATLPLRHADNVMNEPLTPVIWRLAFSGHLIRSQHRASGARSGSCLANHRCAVPPG